MSSAVTAQNEASAAAFVLGITFPLAAVPLFSLFRTHGIRVFRDGLRLALAIFFFGAALWALVGFATILLDPTSRIGCQIIIVFAAGFDQLARLALLQYFVWAINRSRDSKSSADTLVSHALLALRFVVGAVYVGFQRPQLGLVCQSRSESMPVGITVAAADAVLVAALFLRTFLTTRANNVLGGGPGSRPSKANSHLIAGFAVWTGTSVPMFLGLETTSLVLRTALPASTLSILLVLVSLSVDHLALSKSDTSTLAPDQPPLGSMTTHHRDLSSSDSNFPPSRFEDLKVGNITSVTAYPEGRPDVGAGFGTKGTFGAAANITTTVVGTGARAIPVEAPQSRSTLARDQQQVKSKRSIFGRKTSAASANPGQFVISNPIVQQSTNEDSPYRKIVTVDLATAAKNERERRDMAALQNSDTLVAQRPAPQPPAITPEEITRRNQSIKRKQIAPQPSDDSLLSTTAVTTTSTQLSPGVEQIRRRSPRQSPKDFPPLDEQELPLTALQYPRVHPPPIPVQGIRTEAQQPSAQAEMASVSAKRQTTASLKTVTSTAPESAAGSAIPTTRRDSETPVVRSSRPRPPTQAGSPTRPDLPPTWPRQPSLRSTIRPSRTQMSPAQNALPKTPSQRDQTKRSAVGLPSNPRAQSMKSVLNTDAAARPTVLFLNKIQYDDSDAVQNIISKAAGTDQKTALPATAGLSGQEPQQRESIIHRPRPIPRQREKDRQLFPSEQFPTNHRRSRSGGSIISRKSILRSDPGSPTGLPPLPPPPRTAGVPGRPLPNDTRSMTFNEKMDFFFPPSPHFRGSSVARDSIPDVPPLPSAYLPDKNKSLQESSAADGPRPTQLRSPDGSARTSVRTLSILEVEQSVPRLVEAQSRFVSAFSVDTYESTERTERNETAIDHKFAGPAALSSSNRSSKWSEGSKRRSSQVIPDQQGPLSESSGAHIRDEDGTTHWGSIYSPVAAVNINGAQNPSALDSTNGEKVVPIMLDTAAQGDNNNTLPTRRQSEEQKVDDGPGSVSSHTASWHHRVGQKCASFSARKDRVVSRRMPPPTPLLLNVTSSNAYVIRAAEPSPLDSPQEAYEAIQRQLKDLEEASRASVTSDGHRIRLLESLEREMGQQESQWLEMQNGLGRHSISTAETASRGPSRPISSVNTWASPSPLSRVQSLAPPSERYSTTLGVSVRPDDLHSGSWQHNHVLAQLQNHSDHLHPLSASNRHPQSFIVSRAQLSSPTPPDTDESDSEDQDRIKAILGRKDAPVAKLWVPKASHVATPRGSLLWSPASVKPAEPVAPAELPNLSLRPAPRKMLEPLTISSTQLWMPNRATSIKPHVVTIGLWRGAPISASSRTSTRTAKFAPAAQRPSRRSKRITLLPDIPESPEPLPNKRDTLGIFRFPWGEVSDNATIQRRPPSIMLMPMPGTMSSGGGRMLMRAVPSVHHEPSYFEVEYDGEEDDEAISEVNESSDDDDFDETTLWEIASLLKSNQVPSKHSLLPPFDHALLSSLGDSDYDLSDYDEEDEADDDEQCDVNFSRNSNILGFDVNAFPRPPRPSALWDDNAQQHPARPSLGLPQPNEDAWKGYAVAPAEAAARHRYQETEPPVIHSRSLWTAPASQLSCSAVSSNALLWRAPQPASVNTDTTNTKRSLLWNAPPSEATDESEGLFSLNRRRANYRSTTAEPAARDMVCKRRVLDEPVAQLPPFSGLWDKSQPANDRPLWNTGISSSAVKETAEVPLRSHIGLWVAPVRVVTGEPLGLFNPTQKRVDYRTTSSEPIGIEFVQRKISRMEEPPQKLPQSSRLWSRHAELTGGLTTDTPHLWSPPALVGKEKSTSSPTPKASFLWVAPAVVDVPEPQGLFQPGWGRTTFRSTTAEPAALHMPRRLRLPEESLQELPTSSGLWSQSQGDTKLRRTPRGLWSPLEVTDSRQPSTSALLWTAPTKSTSVNYDGLFQAGRQGTRFTTAEPAALHMSRRPRLINEPLKKLPTSSGLWSQPRSNVKRQNVSSGLWGPHKVKVNEAGSRGPISTSALLWTAPARSSLENYDGLFQAGRRGARFTTAEPAALDMTRKPRSHGDPLPELTSTELWAPGSMISYEYDWISISSVGPQSPSYASSSGHSSPISETASMKTTSTRASSIVPPRQHVPLIHAPAGTKQQADAVWLGANRSTRLSVLPEQPELQFTLAAPPASVGSTSGKRVAPPPPPPIRRQYRPLLAYRVDWDAALKEAINASRKTRRVGATPADWDAALEEAIAAGAKADTVTGPSLGALSTRGLWTKGVATTPAVPSQLWSSDQSPKPSPSSANLLESGAEDAETHRLRHARVKARIPSGGKYEVSGSVDVSGQRLWNIWDSEERRKEATRGNDVDWLDSRKQLARFSKVIFRY